MPTGGDLLRPYVEQGSHDEGLGQQDRSGDRDERPSNCPGASADQRQSMQEEQRQLRHIECAEHQASDAEPRARVIPGARNFNGASIREMATTIPNQTNGIATCATSRNLSMIFSPLCYCDSTPGAISRWISLTCSSRRCMVPVGLGGSTASRAAKVGAGVAIGSRVVPGF